MKRNKFPKEKVKKLTPRQTLLHWIGFFVGAGVVILFTAYGFFLSLKPPFMLNSAPEETLGLVGVALANNVGTGKSRADEIPVELPADVKIVQDALQKSDRQWTDFFQIHFHALQEFEEIATIDIVNYLSLHTDRAEALDAYITQLEEKVGESQTSVTSLEQQFQINQSAVAPLQADIKATQTSVEQAYNDRKSDEIIAGLVRLEELRTEEQEHKAAAIFAERIAKEYNVFINASNQKLAILKANKEALVKWVKVILPPGIDIKLLKELNIFSTETN